MVRDVWREVKLSAVFDVPGSAGCHAMQTTELSRLDNTPDWPSRLHAKYPDIDENSGL